jgi:hypothetical protein
MRMPARGGNTSVSEREYSSFAREHSIPERDYSIPERDYSIPERECSILKRDYSMFKRFHEILSKAFSSARRENSMVKTSYSIFRTRKANSRGTSLLRCAVLFMGDRAIRGVGAKRWNTEGVASGSGASSQHFGYPPNCLS